jgi:hypothetical protein
MELEMSYKRKNIINAGKPLFSSMPQITKMNAKKFWKSLKPYKLELYQGEALSKLTTIGILKLRSAEIEASFENITVVLYELFPEKYSLINFPQYPDTMKVMRAMTSHCVTAGYVDGNLKRNSYMLTPKGYKVAEDLLEQIESGTLSQVKRSDLKQSKSIRLVKGVSNTSGFEKFSAKNLKEIKKFDVCESLHCTMDADEEHLKRNLEALIQHANDTKKFSRFAVISECVLEYLQYIKSNWEELIHD